MIDIKKYNESLIQIDCDYDLALNISDYFAFRSDNYMWSPKYKAGVWDGRIRLFNLHNRTLPIGLLKRLVKYLKEMKIEFKLDKSLKPINLKVTKKWLNEFYDKELKLLSKFPVRDYQINYVTQSLKENKCVVLSPTASGKSLAIYMTMEVLRHFYPNLKILLVVPTVGLVEQMEYDFIDYATERMNGNSDYSKYVQKIFSGQTKIVEKPITISTWQSLQKMPKKYFEQFDAIITDECHGATAVEMTKIIGNCVNAKFKIGTTGTLDDLQIKQVQLEGLFGKVLSLVTTKELIKKKILSDFKIVNLVLKYSPEARKEVYKSTYFDESEWLRQNKERTKFILKLLMKTDKTTLLLFKKIEYGKRLFKYLKKVSNKKVYYISGETPVETREAIRRLADKEKNVVIIASLGTFSTGINMPNLYYLILAEPIKSKIKVLQSIGRILRRNKIKTKAVLYDIVDHLTWKRRKNYTLKHFLKRIDIYDKEEFDYSIKEIEVK
jgi:superfamily II DNA or RNA helicase